MATRRDEGLYVQVSQSVLDERTYERETAPFTPIGDSSPKLVLVADRWRLGPTQTGVRVENVCDWLLAGGLSL